MTSLLHRPTDPDSRTAHAGVRVPRRRWAWTVALIAVVAVAVAGVGYRRVHDADARRDYLLANGWPVTGQAAYRLGRSTHASGGQTPAPIASLAKVMTAYVTLHALPLHTGGDGPAITITRPDVRDYRRRSADDQSVVAVRAGETISERQALMAVLLPSANNVAVLLARRVAGSVPAFVTRMNAAAAGLGMAHTHYTDPSGFDARTTSTAVDQLLLATAAGRDGTFASMVATASYRLPVAGSVHNTDSLLGRDGFVGMKTGSDNGAGGCFMFATYQVVDRRVVLMTGVVLGQSGRHPLTAGLYAARQLADRVAPAAHG